MLRWTSTHLRSPPDALVSQNRQPTIWRGGQNSTVAQASLTIVPAITELSVWCSVGDQETCCAPVRQVDRVMTDVERRIEQLEIRAVKVTFLAQLAIEPAKKAYNAKLADALLELAKQLRGSSRA
jgi:hypothetical protein